MTDHDTHTGRAPERPARARRSRRTRPVVAAASAVAAAALIAACSSSGSSGGGSTTASGSSTFKGKTITLIAPDAPGGSYDSYARLFAPYLGQVLGATVNVENVDGGGTLDGTNQLAAASPNGLTIGMVNVGGDVASKVEGQPSLKDDVARFGYLGQPAVLPNALVTQSGESGTFTSLVHSSSPVAVLDIRNGIGDMLNRVVFGAFGIKHNLDTGFESTTSLKQGFLAKDGKTIFEAMSTLYPLISGSEAKPLLVTGTVSLPTWRSALAGVPTLDSELTKVSLPAGQTKALKEANALADLSDDFAVPPGTPAATVNTLRQAFVKAAALPALKKQAQKESLPLAWISGASTTTQVSSAEAGSSSIAPYVK